MLNPLIELLVNMIKIEVKQLAKIESILFSAQFPIRLKREQPVITYMPQGKASDVYKVELPKNEVTYAVKVFNPEQWQAREIDIYEKYLIASALGTPKLIFADKSDGILILSWINTNSKDIDFDQLKNWLTDKYLHFKTLFEGQKIDIQKNIDWMFLNPISKIGKSVEFSNIEAIHVAFKNRNSIKNRLLDAYKLSLPIVLDHADLELQNIISSDNSIYVIDWANAVKSLGFIDFAQFKKLLREADRLGLYERHEQKLSKLLNIKLGEFAQQVSLFSVIREIQLLAYYQDNNIDMEDPRFVSSVAILKDELRFLLI